MFCPFCGKRLHVYDEPLTGGDVLECRCGTSGYGYLDADGTYVVTFEKVIE